MQLPASSTFADRASQLRDSFGLDTNQASQSDSEHEFMNMLGQGIGQVSKMQNDSVEQVNAMLSGEEISPAKVFAGMQKADMAFSLLVQIRNKFIQAYEEINQIRI